MSAPLVGSNGLPRSIDAAAASVSAPLQSPIAASPVVSATAPATSASVSSRARSYLSVATAAAPSPSAASAKQLPASARPPRVTPPSHDVRQSLQGGSVPLSATPSVPLPAPMTHAEVCARLRLSSVGDWLEVDWSYGVAPLSTWTGKLTKKAARGVWSIDYLDGSRRVSGVIPREGITYHDVRSVSAPVGVAAGPPAATNNVASRLRPRVPAPPPSPPPSIVASSTTPAAVAAPSTPAAATNSAFPFVARQAMAVDFSQRRGVVRTRAPASTRVRLPPPSSLGTGIPEMDALYSDLHLSKNVPLPDALTRHSGDKMKTVDLIRLLRQEEVAVPHPMYKHHLAPTTVAGHKRVLRWLRDHLPSSDTPVAVSISATVAQHAQRQKWAPTSWITKLNNIHGALAALFVYRKSQDQVVLAGCPQWSSHLRTVQHMKPLHKPNQPLAMTQEELDRAVSLEPRPEVRAALEIGWLTAARGNDVRQILASDIRFPPPLGGRSDPVMTVTFRRGKTAKKEQYTVGVPLPSQETLAYINQRKVDDTWAFPGVQGEHLKKALRRANPTLEQRSIRRGRLQHLSAKGWSDKELRELSQHASDQMLRRYLDMGVMSSTTHETAVHAARGTTSL